MTVFSFLIAVFAVVLSAGVLAVQSKTALRILLYANIAAAAAGGILLGISVLFARNAAGTEGVSADLLSWAADAFSLWLRMAGTASAAAGGVLLLASLIHHRMRRIRALTGCVLIWVILLCGEVYAVTCAGSVVDPSVWIRICTCGLALLVTIWSIPDLLCSLREKTKK